MGFWVLGWIWGWILGWIFKIPEIWSVDLGRWILGWILDFGASGFWVDFFGPKIRNPTGRWIFEFSKIQKSTTSVDFFFKPKFRIMQQIFKKRKSDTEKSENPPRGGFSDFSKSENPPQKNPTKNPTPKSTARKSDKRLKSTAKKSDKQI